VLAADDGCPVVLAGLQRKSEPSCEEMKSSLSRTRPTRFSPNPALLADFDLPTGHVFAQTRDGARSADNNWQRGQKYGGLLSSSSPMTSSINSMLATVFLLYFYLRCMCCNVF